MFLGLIVPLSTYVGLDLAAANFHCKVPIPWFESKSTAIVEDLVP